eukprot:gene17386-biopygen1287
MGAEISRCLHTQDTCTRWAGVRRLHPPLPVFGDLRSIFVESEGEGARLSYPGVPILAKPGGETGRELAGCGRRKAEWESESVGKTEAFAQGGPGNTGKGKKTCHRPGYGYTKLEAARAKMAGPPVFWAILNVRPPPSGETPRAESLQDKCDVRWRRGGRVTNASFSPARCHIRNSHRIPEQYTKRLTPFRGRDARVLRRGGRARGAGVRLRRGAAAEGDVPSRCARPPRNLPAPRHRRPSAARRRRPCPRRRHLRDILHIQ